MTATLPLNFFVAGFSKCGTTTLSHLLESHPRVALPSIKEPHFFLQPNFDDRWTWYRSLYPSNLGGYTAIGDNSNDYSSHDHGEVIAQILNDRFPDARYIFLARDPVKRIESAYRQLHDVGVNYGIECPFPLHEAMESNPPILLDADYWRSISPFRALVPDDRIMVAYLEDLLDDPVDTMDRVCSFLGVDPGELPSKSGTPHLNAGDGKYRDTALLRRLRQWQPMGQRLARMNLAEQDRILRPLRLRVRFDGANAPEWTPQAREAVRRDVAPGALEFARTYGLPRRGWPKFAELISDDLLREHVTAS